MYGRVRQTSKATGTLSGRMVPWKVRIRSCSGFWFRAIRWTSSTPWSFRNSRSSTSVQVWLSRDTTVPLQLFRLRWGNTVTGTEPITLSFWSKSAWVRLPAFTSRLPLVSRRMSSGCPAVLMILLYREMAERVGKRSSSSFPASTRYRFQYRSSERDSKAARDLLPPPESALLEEEAIEKVISSSSVLPTHHGVQQGETEEQSSWLLMSQGYTSHILAEESAF